MKFSSKLDKKYESCTKASQEEVIQVSDLIKKTIVEQIDRIYSNKYKNISFIANDNLIKNFKERLSSHNISDTIAEILRKHRNLLEDKQLSEAISLSVGQEILDIDKKWALTMLTELGINAKRLELYPRNPDEIDHPNNKLLIVKEKTEWENTQNVIWAINLNAISYQGKTFYEKRGLGVAKHKRKEGIGTFLISETLASNSDLPIFGITKNTNSRVMEINKTCWQTLIPYKERANNPRAQKLIAILEEKRNTEDPFGKNDVIILNDSMIEFLDQMIQEEWEGGGWLVGENGKVDENINTSTIHPEQAAAATPQLV